MKYCNRCLETKPIDSFPRKAKGMERRKSQCQSCQNAKERERRKRPGVRALMTEKARLYRVTPDQKVRDAARWEVKWAVKEGRLVRGTCASVCSGPCDGPIQGHHWSYLKEHWLDVVWLCRSHHTQEHKRLRHEFRTDAVREPKAGL
jgi:hypothetical protein